MRLEELTPEMVRRAVDIYMQHAWPNRAGARPRFDPAQLEGVESLSEMFALCESKSDRSEGPLCARYTLRLGNRDYPFMKFVVQEYLVDEEYFFSVDTHDDIEVPVSSPDYAKFQEIRRHNSELKREIEADWHDAGLPTHTDLRVLAEGLARLEGAQTCRGRLLVVDDERNVARGLAALLSARGYDVEIAYDGRQVLARLEKGPLPDLVVLDYSMPEMDGHEVLDRIRSHVEWSRLPVLLATASEISLAEIQRVSGLLRKPYPREVLFKMVEQLLGRDRA
ncbi:MAG: response regulator [Planctomycetes bacterium]|nr:response regulator [Planctomycetota bacterium]MCB9904282.1 response regulator [Planctomycetota bacterium]